MTDATSDTPSETPAPNAFDDDGRKHGHWQERFAGGQVSEEGEYAAGRKVGVWRSYHPDGTLKRERDHKSA